MPNKIYLSVVAPVFNEEDNIENVLIHWNKILEEANFISEIVLTNDGSTDQTPKILSTLTSSLKRVRVINHKTNCGYGQALSTAIKNSEGEWVITIDSDGQFDLKEYAPLLNKAEKENLDGVIGFRIKKQDSFFRVFSDRVLNKIVYLIFNVRFKDTNCAMKLVKGEILRKLILEAKSYPTPTEIVLKLSVYDYKIAESPITHKHRESGLSKLKPIRTGINFLWFLFYLKVKLLLYRKKILHTF